MTSLHNSASGVILGGEKGGATLCEGEVEILTEFLKHSQNFLKFTSCPSLCS